MPEIRFTIGDGRTYDAADIESLSLRDILTVENETEAMGRRMTFADITEMVHHLGELPDEERATHPDAPWVLAVTIWASRRAAGDAVTFGEAVDIPLHDIKFIVPPADHKAKAKPDPTRPRPASGRGRK